MTPPIHAITASYKRDSLCHARWNYVEEVVKRHDGTDYTIRNRPRNFTTYWRTVTCIRCLQAMKKVSKAAMLRLIDRFYKSIGKLDERIATQLENRKGDKIVATIEAL